MEFKSTNHFGNPLITATMGGGSPFSAKAPLSPVGSTFAKNDNVKIRSRKSFEKLMVPQQHPLLRARNGAPSCSQFPSPRVVVSPNTSFSESDPSPSAPHSRESSVIPAYVPASRDPSLPACTNSISAIGLPSHYPGSAGHFRDNSLENSVFEELQDFDELFGKGVSSLNSSKRAHRSISKYNEEDDSNDTKNRPSASIQNEYDMSKDDKDDLTALSRALLQRGDYSSERTNDDYCDDEDDAHDFPPSSIQTFTTYDSGVDDDDLFTSYRSQTTQPQAESLHSSPTQDLAFSLSLCLSSASSEDVLDGADSLRNNCGRSHLNKRTCSRLSASSSHRRSRNHAMSSQEFDMAVLKYLDD